MCGAWPLPSEAVGAEQSLASTMGQGHAGPGGRCQEPGGWGGVSLEVREAASLGRRTQEGDLLFVIFLATAQREELSHPHREGSSKLTQLVTVDPPH